jgi:hypothetical protein
MEIAMSCRRRFVVTCAAVLPLIGLGGCQKEGPTIVNVTGVLTYKGQPVTNAYLRFRPENGRPSWGQTDEQGRFKLNYDRDRDGAVVGKHKVWLEIRPSAAEQANVMPGAGLARRPAMSRDLSELFDKYSAEKSTLTVEIKPDSKELALNLD